MYAPPPFHMRDGEAEALRLAEENPFATLVTVAADSLYVDHVPLLVEHGRDGLPILVGHFSRKNPHAAALEQAGRTLAVFHGPHGYISPRWYAQYDVPTWNYAVAHVRGAVQMIKDERALVALVGRLTSRFEKAVAPGAALGGPLLPDDLKGEGQLTAAIVGFELAQLTYDVKMKLNQNRSEADQRGAREGLEATGDGDARKLATLMKAVNKV